jgi:hypothetical protein
MVVQVGFGYSLTSERTERRSSSSYGRLEMVVQVGFGECWVWLLAYL